MEVKSIPRLELIQVAEAVSREKSIDKEEVINYLVNNVSNYDCNEHWSDLLNLCLSSENNILGLKISGKEIRMEN